MNTVFLKNRSFWNRLGYILTALWIAFVLLATEGNSEAPLFSTIFLVPLGLWLIIIVLIRYFENTAPPRQ